MPSDSGNNTTNIDKSKIPNQGNFSASQNSKINAAKASNGKLGAVKEIATNSIRNTQNQANYSNEYGEEDLEEEKKLTDNPDDLKGNVKKEVAKKGLETLATVYGGKAGGVAAEVALNSELGDKVLNTAVNATKPKNLLKIVAITSGIGCLGQLILVCAIIAIMLSPIFFGQEFFGVVAKGAQSIWNGVVNFVRGCDSDLECQEKDHESFYNTLNEITKEYEENYDITLNTELIIATLTYYDPNTLIDSADKNTTGHTVPTTVTCSDELNSDGTIKSSECADKYMSKYNCYNISDPITKGRINTYTMTCDVPTETEIIEESTIAIDFKKSKKKIRDLAKNMVSEGVRCVDKYGTVLAEYTKEEKDEECPEPFIEYYYDTENKEEILNEVTKEEMHYIDEERYRSYLEDTFIRKFYFNNKKDEETDKKISMVVNEIYSRAEFVNYLNGTGNTSENFVANNTQVIITDCTGTIELETVSLYDYIQGVLYADAFTISTSESFLKIQAVVVKNYLYAVNGATPDSIPTTLRIRSCEMNQIYCNVEKGCHNLEDGTTSGYDSKDTIAAGPDSSGNYYRPPVTDITTLEKIKSAIDATLSDFIVKDGRFVVTQYKPYCSGITCDSTTNILDQRAANGMVNAGRPYEDILLHFYDGTIQEVELATSNYPLDLVHNRVTSAFGWRVHPIKKICRTHNGTDIAAPGDANIYAIANGIVVSNYFHASYGNVTIIGHNPDGNGNYQYYSLYAHQIRLSNHVKVGDEVQAGQVIGNVGSTGTSTGNHLHIEIYSYVDGKKVRQDPVEYFKGVELTGQVGGALYGSETQCNSCLNAYGAGSC